VARWPSGLYPWRAGFGGKTPLRDLSSIRAAEVVIVPSVIAPSAAPLSYLAVRSIFSPMERYQQTLDALKTVRKSAPRAFLLLAEASAVSETQRLGLSDAVDCYLDLSADEQVVAVRDGPYKGVAEAVIMLKALHCLEHAAYGRLFKITGRYSVSPDFSLERFKQDRISFLFRTDDGVSTRLYCWPKSSVSLLASQLKKAQSLCCWGCSIEDIIWRGLPAASIDRVARLGVMGAIAPDGTTLSE
jgi:hypothetical protein